MQITLRRRSFIIRSVKRGIPPALVADDFDRTRERIRQIFREDVGQNPEDYIRKQPFYKGRVQKLLYLPERFCNRCAKKFTPKQNGAGLHFCSPLCREKLARREYRPLYIRRCYICHSGFMPWRTSKLSYPSVEIKRKGSVRFFCHMDCYGKYRSYKRLIGLMRHAEERHALKS